MQKHVIDLKFLTLWNKFSEINSTNYKLINYDSLFVLTEKKGGDEIGNENKMELDGI